MENIDHEEEDLLNLTLAVVTDESKRKRKSRDNTLNHQLNPCYNENTNWEGRIFRLLETREQMLKAIDHGRRRHHNNLSKGVIREDGKGLQLIHLLLITATSVDKNNTDIALHNLTRLYGLVSLTGDSVQRVVSYFADGLTAKILTRKSPFYDMIMKKPTNEEEFSSFTDLYRVSPFFQFAHFTANQAIIEAFEREEENNNGALHVIDFDVSYGFQWPSLIQSLSEKASNGNRVFFRITGFARSFQELQVTEQRLVSFAKGFRNLVFEFHGLLSGSKIPTNLIRKKPNETVAVNFFLHYNYFLNNFNFLNISDALKTVHSFDPSIVILVEQEGIIRTTSSRRSFMSTFMESLHYFAAMFDSLDDCLPQDSSERLNIEMNHLGNEIKTMMNYEKYEILKKEKIESWKTKMESRGFQGMKLSSKCIIQAKLLLKIRAHYSSPLQFEGECGNGFRVFERDDGMGITLGWQDRSLLTASVWK